MKSHRTNHVVPQRRPAPVADVSLARALSKLGASSRSRAQELIRSGRVRVNGAVLRNERTRVDLKQDVITLDGARLVPQRFRYVAFHKPAGVVTTHADERGRRTVFDVIGSDAADLRAVGRLDKDTTGLLLLTNDHQLADRLTDPSTGVPKTYRAVVSRALTEEEVARLTAGVEISVAGALYHTRPAAVQRGEGTAIDLTITEGKNRQVRKMMEALGVSVVALTRLAVGSITLGPLPIGQWRELREAEVRTLRQSVGTPGARR